MVRKSDGGLPAQVTVPFGVAPILLLGPRSVREEACSIRGIIALSLNEQVPPSK
jgi:hypothetical protein